MNTPVSGNFKPYIDGLIKQKRSLGYLYNVSAWVLKTFSVFCMNHYPDETTITKAMAMQWAERRQDENLNSLAARITPIRQLAKYMHCLGVEAYVIPLGIPGKLPRYIPHIFTDKELQAFFAEIDRCPVDPVSPAMHLVIPVFFRVLYCCGLRSSEARLLKVEDVDLETGKLTIRQSKGNKDRSVMMSEEVLDLCRVYRSKVSRIYPNCIAFFPNQCGKHYGIRRFDDWFHLFWNKTGLTNSISGNLPRVHNFRHTFAVKRLNLWVQREKTSTPIYPISACILVMLT